MARRFIPTTPFTVAMRVMIPTITTVKGTPKKTFPDIEDCPLFFGSFRTFGGTETQSNDMYTVFDTARIDTWYRPDITSDCRIYICDTGAIYDIVGTPEDIEMRHQYLEFKVERVGGTA